MTFQVNKIRNAQKVAPVEMDKLAVDPKSIATFMDSMSKAKKRTGVLSTPQSCNYLYVCCLTLSPVLIHDETTCETYPRVRLSVLVQEKHSSVALVSLC